jgi:hypothetical protein
MGDTFTDWAEIQFIHPITQDFQNFDDRDKAEFLSHEGQLRYELAVELDHFKVRSVNMNNVNLYFTEKGTVHEPELFEAAIKGFHIDTTDFSINTANDAVYWEGHYNR